MPYTPEKKAVALVLTCPISSSTQASGTSSSEFIISHETDSTIFGD